MIEGVEGGETRRFASSKKRVFIRDREEGRDTPDVLP
jgi:hypothetical protein